MTALAAHLSTPVVNVRGTTGLSIVIFVASEETQKSPPRYEEPLSLLAAQPFPRPIPPHLPTPVKISNLLLFLSGYDNSIVHYLATGFTVGFPLHYEGPRFSCNSNNLISAMQNPTAVDAKISKELDACRLAGPFSSPPFPVFRVSPLGLVPKKVEGEFRLIHHLSFPKGSSLNDDFYRPHQGFLCHSGRCHSAHQDCRPELFSCEDRYKKCLSYYSYSPSGLLSPWNMLAGLVLP